MKTFMTNSLIVVMVVFLISCSKLEEKRTNERGESVVINELKINAGAGLKAALDKINEQFTKEHGTKIIPQYMCSAMVLANLLLAKDTDVFFPGSEYFMNKAIEKEAIKRENAFPAAYMVPVITTPKGNPKNIRSLSDLAKPGVKVAWGDLKILAVGRLTEKMLKDQNLYEDIEKNVTYVGPSATKLQVNISLGSVDAGINWKAVTVLFNKKSDYIEIPIEQLKYSIAPCGISVFTKNKDMAQKYVDFIRSPEGRKIFEETGYTLPEGAEKIEKIE